MSHCRTYKKHQLLPNLYKLTSWMVSGLLKQTPCEGYLPLDGATCIQVEQCGKVRWKEDKVDVKLRGEKYGKKRVVMSQKN